MTYGLLMPCQLASPRWCYCAPLVPCITSSFAQPLAVIQPLGSTECAIRSRHCVVSSQSPEVEKATSEIECKQ